MDTIADRRSNYPCGTLVLEGVRITRGTGVTSTLRALGICCANSFVSLADQFAKGKPKGDVTALVLIPTNGQMNLRNSREFLGSHRLDPADWYASLTFADMVGDMDLPSAVVAPGAYVYHQIEQYVAAIETTKLVNGHVTVARTLELRSARMPLPKNCWLLGMETIPSKPAEPIADVPAEQEEVPNPTDEEPS